jgi:hypothetical protein
MIRRSPPRKQLLELIGEAYSFEEFSHDRHGILGLVTRVVPRNRVATTRSSLQGLRSRSPRRPDPATPGGVGARLRAVERPLLLSVPPAEIARLCIRVNARGQRRSGRNDSSAANRAATRCSLCRCIAEAQAHLRRRGSRAPHSATNVPTSATSSALDRSQTARAVETRRSALARLRGTRRGLETSKSVSVMQPADFIRTAPPRGPTPKPTGS